MLTRAVLRDYLAGMPPGDIFDLSYRHFADMFPPGGTDATARAALQALADACDCDLVQNAAAERFELTRRAVP